MKKILYVHHGKGLGGAPLSLLYLVQALDKKKYDPYVLFLHYSDALDLYKKNNIKVLGPVNRYDFSHTKIWWFRWYHFNYLIRSIKDNLVTFFNTAPYWFDKIKPDIVHLNTSSLVAWGAVAKRMNIPVVWHIREPLAPGYFSIRKNFIKSCVAINSSIIVPISYGDSAPWSEKYKKKVIVVYNAVDKKIFNPSVSIQNFSNEYNIGEENPKILFLGGLSREKGTLFILNVFEKVLKIIPDSQLLIAGYFNTESPTNKFKQFFPEYKYKKEVELIVKKLKRNILLLGPIEKVPEAMKACDVVTFPSQVEHFARPIIEAGFMTKPVIASNLSPLNELIIDKKTGFLIKYNDEDAWANKIILLLQDKQLRKYIGRNAYNFCIKKFSIERQAKKIGKIYSFL